MEDPSSKETAMEESQTTRGRKHLANSRWWLQWPNDKIEGWALLSERERGGGEDPEQPERESSQTVKGIFYLFFFFYGFKD